MFTLSEENEVVPFMFDGCDCFALPGCQCVPGQTDKPAAQRWFWFSALPPLQKGGLLQFQRAISLANLKWFRLPVFSGLTETQTT